MCGWAPGLRRKYLASCGGSLFLGAPQTSVSVRMCHVPVSSIASIVRQEWPARQRHRQGKSGTRRRRAARGRDIGAGNAVVAREFRRPIRPRIVRTVFSPRGAHQPTSKASPPGREDLPDDQSTRRMFSATCARRLSPPPGRVSKDGKVFTAGREGSDEQVAPPLLNRSPGLSAIPAAWTVEGRNRLFAIDPMVSILGRCAKTESFARSVPRPPVPRRFAAIDRGRHGCFPVEHEPRAARLGARDRAAGARAGGGTRPRPVAILLDTQGPAIRTGRC